MRSAGWLVLLAVLGGCGAAEPTRRDTDAAVRTVDGYLASLGIRDFARACAKLSKEQRGSGCEGTLNAELSVVPDELMSDLADAKVELGEVDGRTVQVRVRGSGAYASKPVTSTVPVEEQDGAWVIVDLPQLVEKDPVTTCVVEAIQLYEAGETAAYWRKEGRADFVEYSRRLCQAIAKAGADPDSRAEVEPIAGTVIQDMVREGRVKQP